MILSDTEIATLNSAFETESPETMLRWAATAFGPRLTLGTSLGPQGIILMHMLSQIDRQANVFFLDTGLHFQETYGLLTTIQRRLNMTITVVQPILSLESQARDFGESLWNQQPDQCCALRKVEPMRAYLENFDLWITGVRRGHSSTRATTQLLSRAPKYGVLKLNPLAAWGEEQTWDYIQRHRLPTNPLHFENYPSIGCAPCTRPVQAGEDMRAGRWAGLSKTECGLHLDAAA